MATNKTYKIAIAESSPIILAGLSSCLKNLREFNISILEVDAGDSLMKAVAEEKIDLVIANPVFGGLLHPDDIRKRSLNPALRIIAIVIGKLTKPARSLYDDYIHVADDITEIRTKIMSAINPDQEESEEKENLSSREKEIISHVVRGFTNQEIADKLFISVHTVMTHRKNIARKLQIHSATGLTIYAIVNKIVDLSEIKL